MASIINPETLAVLCDYDGTDTKKWTEIIKRAACDFCLHDNYNVELMQSALVDFFNTHSLRGLYGQSPSDFVNELHGKLWDIFEPYIVEQIESEIL